MVAAEEGEEEEEGGGGLEGMGGIPSDEQSTGASRSSLLSMPLSESSILRVDSRPKDPRHSAITARARKAAWEWVWEGVECVRVE